MKISRFKTDDVRKIPLEFRIPEDSWIKYANNSPFLKARNEVYIDEEFQPKYFIEIDKKIIGVEMIWRAGTIRFGYDRITDDLIYYASQVANDLNAEFFISDFKLFPKEKIKASTLKLQSNLKSRSRIEYHKESFGGNNMWLVIKSDLKNVKRFFNLKIEEKYWSECLYDMQNCNGMFICEFKEWIFIAGQLVDSLFNCTIKGESEIEEHHSKKLIEWGQHFEDIQLYMHYDRSMYFNAFYRVYKGSLIYGEYQTESYEIAYGKMTKSISALPDNNANTISSEWSYDPEQLRFQSELKDGKVWIGKLDVKRENR